MINTKDYWRSIRKAAAELDPESARLDANEQEASERNNLARSTKEIWLVSIANENIGTTAGRVVSCHPMNAARMLKDQTHVLASPEQVTVRKAELAAMKDTIEREEADRKGVPQSKLLEALIAGQQPQPRSKPDRQQP